MVIFICYVIKLCKQTLKPTRPLLKNDVKNPLPRITFSSPLEEKVKPKDNRGIKKVYQLEEHQQILSLIQRDSF